MTEVVGEGGETVLCMGCGRTALRGDGITAGGDTWWEIQPPFAVYASFFGGVCACSLDCARTALDNLEPRYLEVEEDLLGHPEHLRGEV